MSEVVKSFSGAPNLPPRPDASGEAAMLLVESLVHELVAGRILPLEAAVDVVQVAIDVQAEIADARGDDPAIASEACRMLSAIATSLDRSEERRAGLTPIH